MNREEFDSWIEGHAAAFGVVRNHFEKATADQLRVTKDLWFGVLQEFEKHDAMEATRRMLSETNLQPYRVEHHPPTIAKLTRRIGADRKSREDLARFGGKAGEYVSCPRCLDEGWLMVWEPASPGTTPETTFVDRGGKEHPIPGAAVTPCPWCAAGLRVWQKYAPAGAKKNPQGAADVEGRLVPGASVDDQRTHLVKMENELYYARKADREVQEVSKVQEMTIVGPLVPVAALEEPDAAPEPGSAENRSQRLTRADRLAKWAARRRKEKDDG